MGENMMGAVRGFGDHLAKEQQGEAEGSSTDSVFFDLGGFMMVSGALYSAVRETGAAHGPQLLN